MSLRTQSLLCFGAAALATLGFAGAPSYKFVLAAVAMMVGLSLWQRDRRQRADRAARLARIEAVEAESDDDEEP